MAKKIIPVINALDIYRLAQHFYLAASNATIQASKNSLGASMILGNPDLPEQIRIMSPAIVMAAFSTELFLKCAAWIDTGEQPKGGHDLSRIYSVLSQSAKDNIEAHFLKYVATVGNAFNLSLNQCLDISSSAFERFRYSYEMKPEELGGFSTEALVFAVCQFILAQNPAWRKWS
jgi:hypothetical protein